MVCNLALKKTLAYKAVFRYPLSFFQLTTFLITETPIEGPLLREALEAAMEKEVVHEDRGKYYLYKVKPRDWFLHAGYSKKHLEDLGEELHLLGKIPWIKLLAVTGSVASFNAEEQDDLDIFVVTQKGRLWLTRGFVFLVLKLLGELGTICPNIFVSEDNLAWEDKRRNLYVAHEIAQMYPLINRDNIYFRFLEANKWIFEYFGNLPVNLPDKFAQITCPSNCVLDFLERLAMKLQLSYMKKKKTVEITTATLIHFNKGDSTKKILKRYQKLNSKVHF